MLVVFRRLRLHMAGYIEKAMAPQETLRYLQFWAQEHLWKDKIIRNTLEHALFEGRCLHYMGLDGKRPVVVDAPLLNETADEVTEEQRFIYIHFRLLIIAMSHMLYFAVMPQSPPWNFCLLLLDGAARDAALAELKCVWRVIMFLASSPLPFHKSLLDKLTFVRWVVFLEVMELLDLCDWNLNDRSRECARIVLDYIRALFSGMKNTLGLENGFNDLRDNEVAH